MKQFFLFFFLLLLSGSTFQASAQFCMDPNAFNFGQPLPCQYGGGGTCSDPNASNFGQPLPCHYASVPGCTDPNALNYNPSATVNNGSCVYSSVQGCTDPNALNYNPSATIDDGSCTYSSTQGCTNPNALNYNPSATIDDGSCVYSSPEGCTDPQAWNYDPSAIIDDGSCQYTNVQGCTDPTAWNYNPNATIDDGSCMYSNDQGCTDPTALNFDPNATIDDGSCIYSGVQGCTDPTALNYNPSATIDDGSCQYTSGQCNAAAGSLAAAATPVCLFASSSVNIAANETTAPTLPSGYTRGYLLSKGVAKIIVQAAATLDFNVSDAGVYAIHTLVYSSQTLNTNSVIQFGVTPISDVLGLLQQGGGSICGAVNVVGAVITVENCGLNGVSEAIDASLNVYPNPNNGQFEVSCSAALGAGSITLMDMMGRTLYSESVYFNGNFRKSIQLHAAKGTYALQIITESGIVTRKVLLQ